MNIAGTSSEYEATPSVNFQPIKYASKKEEGIGKNLKEGDFGKIEIVITKSDMMR